MLIGYVGKTNNRLPHAYRETPHLPPKIHGEKLINRMDELEISVAVVLPIENPEETEFYVTTESVLRAVGRHSHKLIPFYSVDPRRGDPETFDPHPIVEWYVSKR